MRTELSKKEKKLLGKLKLSRAQNEFLSTHWLKQSAPEVPIGVYISMYASGYVLIPLIIAYNVGKLLGAISEVAAFDNLVAFFIWVFCITIPIFVCGLASFGYARIARVTPEKLFEFGGVAHLRKRSAVSSLYDWLSAFLLCGSLVALGSFAAAIFVLFAKGIAWIYLAVARSYVKKAIDVIKDGPVELSGERYAQVVREER